MAEKVTLGNCADEDLERGEHIEFRGGGSTAALGPLGLAVSTRLFEFFIGLSRADDDVALGCFLRMSCDGNACRDEGEKERAELHELGKRKRSEITGVQANVQLLLA